MQKNQNSEWWKRTIAYEIYPSSFQDSNGDGVGDINGITSRLDYLKSLNVGAIWLTPVYASPMVDNGYDVSNFYEINPLYGTMEDMERLIAEAGKRNIKIVMDLVFNHTSEECLWFKESRSSRNNPKSDWYIWRDSIADKSESNGKNVEPNNWRGIFGGSAWEWCEERKQFYLHTFAKQQPDLNWENPDVRKALYDIANFWIEKGVGGFRIDAIPYIKKPADFKSGKPDAKDGMVSIHTMTVNTDGILDFLYEFKKNVTEGKNVFTVAEANGVGPDDLKFWVGEQGAFDMLFEFGHIHDVELWCKPTQFSMTDFKKALVASQWATATNGWYPIFFENHDKPRCASNFFDDSIAKDPTKRVLAEKAIATLLLTLRGTPFIYQGQEIGMTNVEWDSIDKYDEVNSKAQYKFALSEGFSHQQAMECVNRFSRDNSRTPMQWDSSKNAGFTSGKPWLSLNENFSGINVAAEGDDENSVLNWYKRLIEIRNSFTALTAGAFTPLLESDPRVFIFKRCVIHDDVHPSQGEISNDILVLVNLTDSEVLYDCKQLGGSCGAHGCELNLQASSYGDESLGKLRPLEAAIYQVVRS